MLLPTARGVRACLGWLCRCFSLCRSGAAATPSSSMTTASRGPDSLFTTINRSESRSAPAVVNVFPGDYDSVDIGLMGSAIRIAGDLTLRTVDADGDPALGTAQISPASGPAVFTRGPLPENVSIHGFTVISPDDDGTISARFRERWSCAASYRTQRSGWLPGDDRRRRPAHLRFELQRQRRRDGWSSPSRAPRARARRRQRQQQRLRVATSGELAILESSFDDNQVGDGFIRRRRRPRHRARASSARQRWCVVTVGGDVSIRITFDDNKAATGYPDGGGTRHRGFELRPQRQRWRRRHGRRDGTPPVGVRRHKGRRRLDLTATVALTSRARA